MAKIIVADAFLLPKAPPVLEFANYPVILGADYFAPTTLEKAMVVFGQALNMLG